MNIVTALETLALEKLTTNHDEVIETVLSKLFIRGDEVHKAYKHRTADFADLTDRETRRTYITEDFFWNNKMAPEIYKELRAVRKEGERFIHTNDEMSEDWYIVMKKIDRNRDLIHTLETGVPTQEELMAYVKTLQERLRLLTDERKDGLKEFFEKDIAHILSEVIATHEWARTADEFLSPSDVDRAVMLMQRAIDTEPYFSDTIHNISVVIDTNGENILFLDDGVTFIDVMPPKDAWRVHDEYFIVCRTSTDISALQDKKHADILHETFITRGQQPGEIVRMVYEIAAGLIQVPYRKMIGREDLAEKYANFVRLRCDELANALAKKDA